MATKNTNAAAKPAAAKKSAKATKAAEKLFGEKAVADAIAAENATPAEPVVNSAIAAFVAAETTPEPTPPATPVAKAAKVKDVQNGVTRKGAGTVDAKFWGYFDSVVKDTNVLPTLQQAVAFATANGLNVTTAGLSLSYWKRYNGITSKAAKATPKPVELATPAEFAAALGTVEAK